MGKEGVVAPFHPLSVGLRPAVAVAFAACARGGKQERSLAQPPPYEAVT